jgi:hypothetical protein
MRLFPRYLFFLTIPNKKIIESEKKLITHKLKKLRIYPLLKFCHVKHL